jgi:hypothetical protein
MTNVWDWLNSINYTKDNLLEDGDIKQYVPYVVNRALSYHLDSVLFANEMNRFSLLDSKSQYLFYLYSLKKRDRRARWVKKEDSENLQAIKKYYGYNDKKAYDASLILSKEEIEYIKNKLESCGFKND